MLDQPGLMLIRDASTVNHFIFLAGFSDKSFTAVRRGIFLYKRDKN
jgi:hypothetical protein